MTRKTYGIIGLAVLMAFLSFWGMYEVSTDDIDTNKILEQERIKVEETLSGMNLQLSGYSSGWLELEKQIVELKKKQSVIANSGMIIRYRKKIYENKLEGIEMIIGTGEVKKEEKKEQAVNLPKVTPSMVSKVNAGFIEPPMLSGTLYHIGFLPGDYRQDIVRYAYSKGGLDLVILFDCESGTNPLAIGDKGRAYGLCQNNANYRTVTDKYKKDRKEQVDVCYELRKAGTTFYGPDRPITKNGKFIGICRDVVKSRFVFK